VAKEVVATKEGVDEYGVSNGKKTYLCDPSNPIRNELESGI
jgi:hypothetical protein